MMAMQPGKYLSKRLEQLFDKNKEAPKTKNVGKRCKEYITPEIQEATRIREELQNNLIGLIEMTGEYYENDEYHLDQQKDLECLQFPEEELTRKDELKEERKGFKVHFEDTTS